MAGGNNSTNNDDKNDQDKKSNSSSSRRTTTTKDSIATKKKTTDSLRLVQKTKREDESMLKQKTQGMSRRPQPRTVDMANNQNESERIEMIKSLFEEPDDEGLVQHAAEASGKVLKPTSTRNEVMMKQGHRYYDYGVAVSGGGGDVGDDSEEEWSESSDDHGNSNNGDDDEESDVMMASPTRLEYGRNVQETSARSLVGAQRLSGRSSQETSFGHSLVGAQRVIGESSRRRYSNADDGEYDSGSLVIGGGGGVSQELDLSDGRHHTLQSYSAQAELVSDPIVAVEVGEDRTNELIHQFEQERQTRERVTESLEKEKVSKRRVMWIGTATCLISVIIVSVVLSVVLRNSGSSDEAAAPTPSPTPSPTTQQEAMFVSLIQSNMPSITFEEDSPQQEALDWISTDPFTLDLRNDEFRVIQRFALAVLYFATSGPTSWNEHNDGWVTSTTECEWGQPDLECPNGDNVVLSMGLRADGLDGSLPKEIGLLTKLEWMNIHTNNFPGTIPTEIGLMTSLRHFDVRACNLRGTIPTEFILLTKLTVLNLGVNEFTGTIHSELGSLTKLTWLNFPINNLSGTLPPEIIVPTIERFGMKANYNLTGPLPSEQFAKLTNLKEFYISETQLTGTVPSNLCETLLETGTEVDCDLIECDCCSGINGTGLSPCPPRTNLTS